MKRKSLVCFLLLALLLLLVACGADKPECSPHTDNDGDKKCDECGAEVLSDETVSECTEHTDADKNHKCDVCEENIIVHTDVDKNYKCDYCGIAYTAECTEHTDVDKNNKCDYCGIAYTAECSEHTDVDKNHKCDYCDADYTAECIDHEDVKVIDHKCDYCSIELVDKHYDADSNHKCDICFAELVSEHYDLDRNHLCDACGASCTVICENYRHRDQDKDHICDYCLEDITDKHIDNDKDHKCDTCGAECTLECNDHIDADKNDKCDYCEKYCGDSKYRIWANDKLIDKSYLMNLIPYTNGNPFVENPKIYYGVVVPAIPIFEAFGALIEEKSDDIIEVTMNGATLIINKSDLRMINKETGADESYADPGGFGYFEIIDGEVILSDVLLCQVAHYVFGVEIGSLSFKNDSSAVFYQVVK